MIIKIKGDSVHKSVLEWPTDAMLDNIIKLYRKNSSWGDFFSTSRVQANVGEVSQAICLWFSFGHEVDYNSPLFKATLEVFNQQLDRVIKEIKAEEMACEVSLSQSPRLSTSS